MSDEPTFETDPAVWAMQHPTDKITVSVRCPSTTRRERPHVVAEIQRTPFGCLLKVYQRDGRPRSPMEPTGELNDLSRLVNKPGYEHLERIRRERQAYLRDIGEVPQDKLYGASRTRARVYNANEPFPDDWAASVICRCANGVITGPMLNDAATRAKRTGKTVFVSFEVGTR